MMLYPTASGGNVLVDGQHWRGKLQRPQGGDLAIHLDKGLLFDGRARGLAQVVTVGTGGDPLIVDGRAEAGRLDCQLLDPAASRDPLQLTGTFAGDELTGTLTGRQSGNHQLRGRDQYRRLRVRQLVVRGCGTARVMERPLALGQFERKRDHHHRSVCPNPGLGQVAHELRPLHVVGRARRPLLRSSRRDRGA